MTTILRRLAGIKCAGMVSVIKFAVMGMIFVSANLAFAFGEEVENQENLLMADTINVTITSAGVQPDNLEISAGTTVIWINQAPETVMVRFIENAISTTCKAPRGFLIGVLGLYESSEIIKGDVASLCFLEPNSYRYQVSFVGQAQTADEPTGVKPPIFEGFVKVSKKIS